MKYAAKLVLMSMLSICCLTYGVTSNKDNKEPETCVCSNKGISGKSSIYGQREKDPVTGEMVCKCTYTD
jgi:hypothetical protein